jgi:hypothetical protein
MSIVKLIGGNTLHTPTSYSTLDRAVYVRLASYNNGGTNFGVFSYDGASYTRVAHYALEPFGSIIIKKDPDHYVGSGSSTIRCSAVAVEG